jgi:hypothetical protein
MIVLPIFIIVLSVEKIFRDSVGKRVFDACCDSVALFF